MKQTAVEWLFEEILDDKLDRRYEIFKEALEMEKEQLSDAWYAGDEDGPIHDFEDYYQETFGSSDKK